MSLVTFEVPGEPQGKGRARVGRVNGHARMFTPEKTVAYEGLIAMSAKAAMGSRPPTDRACMVIVVAYTSPPRSWSKKRQAMALAGDLVPTKKPDADNIAKAVGDGCNGVVWVDDAQIVDMRVSKRYASAPCLRVEVMHWSL